MKDKTPYLIILLFIITALLLFIIYFAIPKAAVLTLPFKWNHIPVGEKKFIVHQYLGKPVNSNKSILKEEWIEARENGEYLLTVFYDKDTIASNYDLAFNYHLGFFNKRYDIKEAAENMDKK